MNTLNRRSFIKQTGGILLPVAAGLPLVSKAQLNRGLPRCCSFATPDDRFTIIYFLDSVINDPPHGTLYGSDFFVIYGAVSSSGNTIYFSSARPGSAGDRVPSNCREVSLTITEYSSSDSIVSSGKAQLRLSDGTAYSMIVSGGAGGACFLTTACTAARELPDDCKELQALRAFRDGYMTTQVSDGLSMIREYYAIAPRIVSAITTRDDAAEIHDWIYRELVVPSVHLIKRGQNARALDHYAGFFTNLRSQEI